MPIQRDDATDVAGRFAAYVPGLRRYFARRVPSSDVDDLVQDVFLRIQVLQTEQPIEHLDRYLFRVAASVLTDTLRRRAVRHRDAHETLEEAHHPADDLSPERVIQDREALEVVVRSIEELPERTRDIFLLHRFEEMSCAVIARHLSISTSAVEKHLMKAMRFLQQRLEAD